MNLCDALAKSRLRAAPLDARSIHAQYWVHRFEAEGLAGLAETDRPGRPARLDEQQLATTAKVLR